MLSHDTFCNKHAHKKYDVWCTQPHLFYKMECYETDLQILQDKNNAKHENEKFGSFFTHISYCNTRKHFQPTHTIEIPQFFMYKWRHMVHNTVLFTGGCI